MTIIVDVYPPVAHDASMRRRQDQMRETSFLQQGSKDTVTQTLIARFQEMLREGLLTQGSRLPSERELATHFNVARSSLRQALKVLEILGVITQRVGDGSYLNADASAVMSVPMEFLFLLDDTSVQELTELRLLMEPGLARLAAERASSEDIALLRESIVEQKKSSSDLAKLVASDLLFHRAIYQASGNRPAGRLFHTIHRSMAKMMMVTAQLVELEHTLSFHQPILEAIEQRNGDEAAALMTAHMRDATDLLGTVVAQQRNQRLRKHVAAKRRPLLPVSKGRAAVRGRTRGAR